MTDRTDIACIIAEWWHHQKEKKHLLESTITLEQFLRIDKLEPLEVIEDVERICIQKPGGRKKTIWKKNKVKEPPPKVPIVKARLSCSTCHYEIYYTAEQEEGLTYNRDCLCSEQDFFNRFCPLKYSLAEIQPVKNCRNWKHINGYKKILIKEQTP